MNFSFLFTVSLTVLLRELLIAMAYISFLYSCFEKIFIIKSFLDNSFPKQTDLLQYQQPKLILKNFTCFIPWLVVVNTFFHRHWKFFKCFQICSNITSFSCEHDDISVSFIMKLRLPNKETGISRWCWYNPITSLFCQVSQNSVFGSSWDVIRSLELAFCYYVRYNL